MKLNLNLKMERKEERKMGRVGVMSPPGWLVLFRGQECRFGNLEGGRVVVTLVGEGEGEVFLERGRAEYAVGRARLESRWVEIRAQRGRR